MESRKINKQEQGCISECIFRFWGDRNSKQSPEQREEGYQRCLAECKICG